MLPAVFWNSGIAIAALAAAWVYPESWPLVFLAGSTFGAYTERAWDAAFPNGLLRVQLWPRLSRPQPGSLKTSRWKL